MTAFQPPKGTRDILYEEASLRRRVLERLTSKFLEFGYSDQVTPSFEHFETLAAKAGEEIESQIYSFKDKAARNLGLRFEFTASLGRVVATKPELLKPYKRFQIGEVWRYESPQKYRYREFLHADIDIMGPSTMDCEIEIFLLIADVLKDFGLDDFVINLNNRKIVMGQLELAGIDNEQKIVVMRGLDKLDKISLEKVREYIITNGVSEEKYEKFINLIPQAGSNDEIMSFLMQYVDSSEIGHEGIDEIQQILEMSAGCGLANCIKLAPFLVRGLDYYTGPIFEVRSPVLGNVSFGGGGRYDFLVELYGGQPCGAVGFAFGVARLIAVVEEKGLMKGVKSEAELMLAVRNKTLATEAFNLAEELRRAGIKVFQYVGETKLGKQLSFASRMGFPYVLVVGESEIETGNFKIKIMATGDETEVMRNELAEKLKQLP